ncbi:MAG: hypothetical protein GXY50_04195 [Syntrophomonadaceae bacterium]|nr:hypothetical protein [Syntrophomonadaceae bacterium]
MSCYYLIGIRMDNRVDNALNFQDLLTKNGCNIRMRLGLHETSDDVCANDGIIVLQPCGEKEDIDQMVKDLNNLQGVTAKLIDLN